MSDGDHVHELVIIKRHGSGRGDDHHGGVWKIAFADFMTAMMAFFLVMWLISANDKTKATIASYFNPVKLVDTTTQPKGLEDAKAAESSTQSKAQKNAAKEAAKEAAGKEKPPEVKAAEKAGAEEPAKVKEREKEKHLATALLDDPYAALTEIAGSKGAGDHSAAPPANTVKTAVNAISRKGGEAFRDPFAPPPPMQRETRSILTDDPEEDARPVHPGGDPEASVAPSGKAVAREADPAAKPDAAASQKAAAGAASPTPSAAAPAVPAPAVPAQAMPAPSASELKAQLVAAAKGAGPDKAGPQIDVRRAEGGLLVSLTDSADFEMFGSGSIVPSRKVVLMMDRIATVLKAKPGAIVLRGYTDSRPYRNARYDNWRLSIDRAQVTHAMLVRGGLDEARLARIEGYADRNPKNAADPAGAVNRRIEILLKDAAP